MVESHGVEVLGEIWHGDRDERTPLGRLVAAAKDHDDDASVALIAAAAAEWAATEAAAPPPGCVVVGLPASPDRPNRLVPAVARALASTWQVACDDVVVRHRPTVRLRDLDPSRRPAMVVEADYEVTGSVRGRAIVLVDDVVLTGTTLHHVADLLFAAGADAVRLVAVARSRR